MIIRNVLALVLEMEKMTAILIKVVLAEDKRSDGDNASSGENRVK